MRHAFSLVELSIVLVILGLLTGGVLTGQSLIRAAELRSITVEFQLYQTAINGFKGRYFALPGDMRNATDFWGGADGSTGETVACKTVSSATGTCNGDGNGKIESTVSYSNEWFRAWQHLGLAGLIEGNYSGLSGALSSHEVLIGENIPASKLSATGFTLAYRAPGLNATQYYEHRYGNLLYWGKKDIDGQEAFTFGGAISGQEAWSVDKKVDDGSPAYGKVLSFKKGSSLGGDCTTSVAPSEALYDVGDENSSCSFMFMLQ